MKLQDNPQTCDLKIFREQNMKEPDSDSENGKLRQANLAGV
jgi:hypothetical protein